MAHSENSTGERARAAYFDSNLQIVFAVTLMAVLGVASIAPALPKIMEALNISPREVSLLITVFTLPGVLLTIVMGVLADRFGRKRILVPSLMLFGIAGGACALVSDFNALLVLRFLQGIGTAGLAFLNVTIIGDLYQGKMCTAAMCYNASVLNVAVAIYPTLGGAVAMFGWHYPFLLPVAAIPIGLVVLFGLDNPEPKVEQSFREYLGNAWESVKNRQAIGVFAAGVVTYVLIYGPLITYVPIITARNFGASSFVIGLVISSMSITGAITSSQLGRLAKFYPEKNLIKISFVLFAVSLVLVPLMPDLWLLFIPTIIFGVAHGAVLSSMPAVLADLTPLKHRAAFMSIYGTFTQTGMTLGPLIMGAIFGIFGIGSVFFAGSILSVAMFVLAVLMIK